MKGYRIYCDEYPEGLPAKDEPPFDAKELESELNNLYCELDHRVETVEENW